MQWPELPRADAYLARHAARMGATDAWVEGARHITFAQAAAWVDAIATSLLADGVQQGDRIAVYGKPSPEFMALFLAISGIGAIYVGLNPKYTANELAVILDDCRPVAVFNLLDSEDEHARKLQSLALRDGGCGKVLGGIASERGPAEPPSVRQSIALNAARAAVRDHDTALLVYTSGTTGKPKGAQLTHRGIVFIAPVTNDPSHFGVEGQGRTLCNLPINHVGCVIDLCTNSLIAGTTVVFQPDFDPDAMLEAVERHRLTMIGGVPAMFLALSRSARFRATDYTSLQRIVIAGNQPPLPLVRLLKEVTGRPVMNGYGLTEAMGFSTFTNLSDDAETIANTVAGLDPRVEWRIADAAGLPCPPGVAGEIQLRGNWLFSGYFAQPQATAEAFAADGWFRTGDLAVAGPSGNVRLAGRAKEMFKSGGYNVFPLEIEQALEALPEVTMAVVVPVPDPLYSEVGYAYFVGAGPGSDPERAAQSLKAQLRGQLANYKLPKYFEQLQDLPMLPIGKVDRLALKKRALHSTQQGEPAPEPVVPPVTAP